MPTPEEYAQQSPPERIERLRRTADELAAAIHGRKEADLARRPDAKNWAAKEVVCHLRDTEEFLMSRVETLLAMNEPQLVGIPPGTPDRWAEDRQYLRNDVHEALAAFRRRRQESVEVFRNLRPDQWKRGGTHPTRGRMTVDEFLTLMVSHDDNHLDQLKRALEGRA